MTLAIHYCFTSAFMWMIVEGIHLYMASRNYNFTRKFLYAFSAVGWVVPFVIVAVSYGVFKNNYRAKETCWLSAESGSIYVFYATVVLNILINSVCLASVIRTFLSLRSNKNKHKIEKYRASIKAVLLLQPILGLTWIFGFVAATTKVESCSNLFVIFNGLQGVFILLFHCLDNNEVKKTLRLIRNKRKATVMFSKRNQSTSITDYNK
ncbi:adhesion G-protein coupled receptor D1-like [Anneissia japonica]|uniref:adhesion G-protein coupled receptor D1-like n=1 Tax=Anneissia japonica TaxID=1529436 RepID=UPI0014259D02|nr:adhesion G-protein coupled receptor D1-like [Anneissia japonica]